MLPLLKLARMDIRKLKTILDLFEKSSVHELELSEDGESLRLTKKTKAAPRRTQVAQPAAPTEHAPPAEAPEALAKPAGPEPAKTATPEQDTDLHELSSPMVGTFYAQPSPDDPAFVKVGDEVSEGETVCVIEAMKLFNNVNAPVSGKIVSIEMENGQPVGYGDLLMKIKLS